MADHSPSSLGGKRIVITRSEPQSAPLASALRAHGAEVVLLPLIQILPPLGYEQLDSALCKFTYFDWLIFTSQNAVTATAERLASLRINVRDLPPASKIAVVGKATAEAAQLAGFKIAHIGQGGTAATLVHELAFELRGRRVLLPRSDRAASELVPRLQKFGAEVTDVIAYRTVNTTEIDPSSREAVAHSDAILFFSPSAVHSFAALQQSSRLEALADGVVVGAIGPITSIALRNAEMRCHFQTSEPSVEEIVATLAVHFEKIKVQSVSGADS